MARWHALWLNPALAPEVEREVNVERVRNMSRQQGLSAIAHVLNAGILATAAWPYMAHGPVIAVLAVFAAASLWQLWAWWRHRSHRRPSSVSDRTISRVVLWSVWLGGLWGVLITGVLARARDPHVELLTFLIMAGMGSGGTMMLYPIPAALVAFLAAMLLPSWILVAMQPDHLPSAFHVYASVYLGFLLISARFSYANFIEGVDLRIQNAELAYKADAANRAKSRFLANMSHELRTPLNAIIGFAEVIHNQFKGPVGNAQYVEFARSIHESGRHLVAIINDILDLSKVEEGKLVLEEEPVRLPEAIERLLGLISNSIVKAELTVKTSFESGLPAVSVDPRKIDQILLNVLSNAVKFTPPGGAIMIEARRDGEDMTVRVNDTGAGIPQEELSEVLKPFVQSRDAERRRMPGTGLGLPLADQFVKLHGGTLTLASVVGEGTTVTIRIPSSRILAGPEIPN